MKSVTFCDNHKHWTAVTYINKFNDVTDLYLYLHVTFCNIKSLLYFNSALMVSWIFSHLVSLCFLLHITVRKRITARLPKWLGIRSTALQWKLSVAQFLV